MTTFVARTFPELVQINSPEGRFYKVSSGETYPSVSTVCGFKSKQAIQNWKDRVGEVEANRISRMASNRGTSVHKLCEDYIRTGTAAPDMFDQEIFDAFIPVLNKIDNVEAIEQPLYSKLLKIAGTVDLIATLNGVPSVIDFKTSSRIKSKEEIAHYFCQTFCYGQSFFELTGIRINQLVIIMGIDHEKLAIYIERAQDWRSPTLQIREEFRALTGF